MTLAVEGTDDYEELGALGIFGPSVPTFNPEQDIRDFREDELKRESYELNLELAVFVEGEIAQEAASSRSA